MFRFTFHSIRATKYKQTDVLSAVALAVKYVRPCDEKDSTGKTSNVLLAIFIR